MISGVARPLATNTYIDDINMIKPLNPQSCQTNVSDSVCDHPPRYRHYYNDEMYKCHKCGKIVKQTVY